MRQKEIGSSTTACGETGICGAQVSAMTQCAGLCSTQHGAPPRSTQQGGRGVRTGADEARDDAADALGADAAADGVHGWRRRAREARARVVVPHRLDHAREHAGKHGKHGRGAEGRAAPLARVRHADPRRRREDVGVVRPAERVARVAGLGIDDCSGTAAASGFLGVFEMVAAPPPEVQEVVLCEYCSRCTGVHGRAGTQVSTGVLCPQVFRPVAARPAQEQQTFNWDLRQI